MKRIVAAAAAAAGLTSIAWAGEWAEACVARLEADGRDTSGCQCLEDAITENPALEAEFRALAEIADPAARYHAASDAAKAAMDDCTR
ncbi:MAG TPA: hypothetical protein DDZ68_00885 [Parvularcula sp.]|nr:hypothetical protein [Parvularcula sp.]HBS31324.1 hypothetical protein [Parvularcula sp.]HBS34161.1 hypothetical protein [Parvularcula sp.]